VDDEAIAKKAFDNRLMRRLLRYSKPYWLSVATATAFMLLGSVTQVAGPMLTKVAVDRYLAPPARPEPTLLDPYLPADPWTGISLLSGLFLAGMIVNLVCAFAEGFLMQRTGQLAMFDLRRDLVSHLHRLDLSVYDRQPVGRLVTRITTDVDTLNELFASGLVAILGDTFVLLFLLAAMVYLSPGMALLLLSVMPLVILATRVFRGQAQSANRRIRVAVAGINSFLQEHVTGMAVVQLFNREARAIEQFDAVNASHRDAYRDAIHSYGWFYPVVEFLGVLGLAALLAYGGYRIERGELTIGALVAFFQYGVRFFRPIQDLSEKYGIFQQAMAAGERIFQLLDTAPGIQPPAAPKPFPPGPAAIEFDHVWFAYTGEEWVLRDVSFRIEPGETVAVVGHTGAGKTTLTSLLLRFYDIQKGAIRFGGVDIRDFDPRELRRQFGVVLQDPFLFTGDIASNIRLGTASITEEQLRSAAARVNLLDFIDSLPEGMGQPVRERGAGLSTGQKQLISFARALAHSPRFLILDEATSSVDTETEMMIRDALDRLLEGRTSVVIAHRLSTVQRASRILVMHKGELRESGTHQQLLARRGLYWKLYQLAFNGQSAAAGPESGAPEPRPA